MLSILFKGQLRDTKLTGLVLVVDLGIFLVSSHKVAHSSDVEEIIVVLHAHPEAPVILNFMIWQLLFYVVVPKWRFVTPVSSPFFLAPRVSD